MVVTDAEIYKALSVKDFWNIDAAKNRKMLAQHLLEYQAGFEKEMDVVQIMFSMNLIGLMKGSLTKKGQMFIYEEFNQEII